MNSMDDVLERMKIFCMVLQNFHDSLELSLSDLRARNDDVIPHWPMDNARRFYEQHYGPLHETLLTYVNQQGPEYIAFLEKKAHAIDGYLHG